MSFSTKLLPMLALVISMGPFAAQAHRRALVGRPLPVPLAAPVPILLLAGGMISGALISPCLVHAQTASSPDPTTTTVNGPTGRTSDMPFEAVELQGDIRSLQSQVKYLQSQVQNLQSQNNAQTEYNAAELQNIPGGG